jgi:hypothetical protein
MARVHGASHVETCANRSTPKPITLEEIHKLTWASLPSVKVGPVVLEAKPLFEISGGDHDKNRPTRS